MSGLTRRSFFGVSVGGWSTLHGRGMVLAASPSDTVGLSPRGNIGCASAMNLSLFLQNKDTLGLTGLVHPVFLPITGERSSIFYQVLQWRVPTCRV